MRLLCAIMIVIALAAAGIEGAFAQDDLQQADGNVALQGVTRRTQNHDNNSLTPDDRISLLAAALDKRVRRQEDPDCSHLVHAVYEAAGFPYAYAPSSELYAGVDSFERVKTPLSGDLVVWRGHVGIVVKPSEHIFFSYLSSGPGTDNYETKYWRHRGRPRFYRYVKK